MKIQDMITVLAAAEMGKKIETRVKDDDDSWCELISAPSWDFSIFDYRVKPSPVAAGHNPDGLLALNEVAIRGDEQLTNGEWIKILVNYPIEKYMPCAVRAKRPLTVTKEVPLTAEDFAEGLWLVRYKENTAVAFGVVVVVSCDRLICGQKQVTFVELAEYERRNLLVPNAPWEPCKKTITVSAGGGQ